MKDLLLLIYPALVFLLVFWKARLPEKGGENAGFLCLEQTKMIQAGACVGIIIHHMTQQITFYGSGSHGPITIFAFMGILFTSIFFFFSGYGLITSVYTREDYLRKFLYTRLPTVLIPFWVINALGVLLNTQVYGIHWDTAEIWERILGITLVNGNGWFIIEIAILYLIFYILFRLIRNRDIALALLCVATVALIVYSFRQGHNVPGAKALWFRGEWWYNSTPVFIFGLLFARFREKITGFFRKHYVVMTVLFTVLMMVTFFISIYFVLCWGYYREDSLARYSSTVTLISQITACLTFTVFVLLIHMKVAIGNRALKYMSTLSRELFLIHGYFVSRIFTYVRINNILRYAVVLACSIACSAVVSPCVRWLVRQTVRLLSRIAEHLSAGMSRIRGIAADAAASFEAATGIPVHLPSRNSRLAGEEGTKTKQGRRLSGKSVVAGAVVCLAVLACIMLFRNLAAGREYRNEYQTLQTAEVGDEVLWGHFEMDTSKMGKEHVPWIVVDKDDESVLLLSRYGIAGNSYHRKHEEVTWEDSDLRKVLNSEEYTGIFSRQEKEQMLETDGDLVTLLTAEQALEYFPTDEDRTMSITEAAKKQGVNVDRLSHEVVWFDQNYSYSWWWLRGASGEKAITAPIIDLEGRLCPALRPVNKPSGAIRPAIRVRI